MKSILIGLVLGLFSVTAMAQGSDPAHPSVPGPACGPVPAKKAEKPAAPQFTVNCSRVVVDVAVAAEAGSSFTVNAPLALAGDCVIVENPLVLTAKGDGASVVYTGDMKIKGAIVEVTDGAKGTKLNAESDPSASTAATVSVTANVEHTQTPMPVPAGSLPPQKKVAPATSPAAPASAGP